MEEWNRQESRAREDFAGRIAPDFAMLETSPFLGADKILARLAWLAYLSRHEPDRYGGPFLREWIMVRQYRDYCGRTLSYEIGQNKLEGARAALVRKSWRDLSRRFGALQDLSRDDVHAMLKDRPGLASDAFKTARFTCEVQTVRNLLGSLRPRDAEAILRGLRDGGGSRLAPFAAARLR